MKKKCNILYILTFLIIIILTVFFYEFWKFKDGFKDFKIKKEILNFDYPGYDINYYPSLSPSECIKKCRSETKNKCVGIVTDYPIGYYPELDLPSLKGKCWTKYDLKNQRPSWNRYMTPIEHKL